MIHLPIFVAVYFALMYFIFDNSIAPVGKKLQRGFIKSPKMLIEIWVLVAGALFPMASFVKARSSDWELSKSLSAMSVLLGVILGMSVEI